MDCKELIEELRKWCEDYVSEMCADDVFDCYDLCSNCQKNCIVLRAATAIETMLAEREAAVEELRGICWCCAYGKKWDKAPEWSKMTTCEHMGEQFGRLARVGKSKCPHWQWRGPTPPDRQQTES